MTNLIVNAPEKQEKAAAGGAGAAGGDGNVSAAIPDASVGGKKKEKSGKTAPVTDPVVATGNSTASIVTTSNNVSASNGSASAGSGPKPSVPVFSSKGYASAVINMDEYHYTLTGAVAKCPNGDAVTYYLIQEDGNVIESNSGRFTMLKPTQSGRYQIYAVNRIDGSQSETVSVSGFKEIQPIKGLSAAELVSIYSTGRQPSDFKSFESNFRNGFTITYNGMDTSDELNALPSTHQMLFQKFRTGVWSSMTITEVKYDCLHRIASINVNYVKAS